MTNYRALTKNMTWLERHVLAIVYTEHMTIRETAFVLEIPVCVVENILCAITLRLIE